MHTNRKKFDSQGFFQQFCQQEESPLVHTAVLFREVFVCAWMLVAPIVITHNCFLRHMRHLSSILHRSLRPRYRMLSSLPPLTYRMSTRPLDFYTGPLVWIDCEMTGLNPRKDKILEIAVGELPDFWQCIWPTISLPGSHNERKPRACRWWNSIHHQNRKECPGWVCPL